ncbi:MAG: glycosyltransferase family 4 protein [Cyclobacteriaceae bacterium]|nr:glycosyltransferase family 4 protein [Cyclobacteriaceae bacterium]MDX5465426.1 glycosyltransferase family 4 protein [Cyclobacteriaceae bacterium]
MKIFAYNDFILKKYESNIYGDDSHVLFIDHTGTQYFEKYLLGSRVKNSPQKGYYLVKDGSEKILPLPNYSSVSDFLKRPGLFGEARKILKPKIYHFDVFWLTWPHPISFLILLLIGKDKPKVLFIRQNLEALIQVRYSGIQRKIGLLFTRLMYAYAKRFHPQALIVTVGEEMYKIMQGQFQKVHFISDCIVPSEVAQAPRKFPEEKLKLIFVGRLEAEKGIPVLLHAIKILREKFPLQLTLVGEGACQNEIDQIIAAESLAEEVVLVGYVPFGEQLFELYKSHHLMVISSYSEGLPKIINEARAFALPIVSTEVGGIAKELKNENTVIFSPPGDSLLLAQGIEKIWTDKLLYEKISRNLSEEFKTNSLEYWSGKFASLVRAHVRNQQN